MEGGWVILYTICIYTNSIYLGTIRAARRSNQSTLKEISPEYSLERKKMKSLSHVQLFETPWTVAHQAPPSMGFSRQEYWSGLSFPSPGDLSNPGIEPGSPAL